MSRLARRTNELRQSIDSKAIDASKRGPIAKCAGRLNGDRMGKAHFHRHFRDPDHFFKGADRSGCARARDHRPVTPNGFVSGDSEAAHDCRRASRLTNANATWELNMPRDLTRVLRHDVTQRTHKDWAIAIPVGLVIAGVLGFVAFYPKPSHLSKAGQAETVGVVTAKPEPVPAARKPVRYEATIENWKRYRAATKSAENPPAD
ncbi:hypothetical protein [Bradyrhizobium sp. OAE829]|uniref:hypothetical protein n=1 Tax=Bradyrhizobium sp. OAE829 TaxID=2663807 RepID=UPI00178B660E